MFFVFLFFLLNHNLIIILPLPLKEKKEEIKKAQSVDAVVEILVNYSLLEHIVKTYCNRSVKQEMKMYKQDYVWM